MTSPIGEIVWTPVRLGLRRYRCEWEVRESGAIFLAGATHRGRVATGKQREELFVRGLTWRFERELLDRVLDNPQRADFWRRQAQVKRAVRLVFGWLILAALVASIWLRHPFWHRLGPELGEAAWIATMGAIVFLALRLRAITLRALRVEL